MNAPKLYRDLYPGRFLDALAFDGKKVTLTVKGLLREELEDDLGKKVKPIMAFEETPLILVLCKTNGLCLRALFGDTLAEWVGKRVTFWPTVTTLGAQKDVPCVRVWGSPHLEADATIKIKLPRRKEQTVTLHSTKEQSK